MTVDDGQLGDAKRAIAARGEQLLRDGLVQQTSGNLSVRVGDRVAISPGGVPYPDIEPADVAVVDRSGTQVDAGPGPSSETPMHVAVYAARGDVGAVVHTHSPYATTLACLGRGVRPTHYLIAVAGPDVPVAPYGRNGTTDLATKAVAAMGDRNAVLLRNHGVLAVGETLDDACDVAARVEFCARMDVQASRLGEPELLDGAELAALRDYFDG